MSQGKSDRPAVMTYSNYEVISPPNKLRGTVSTVASIDPKDDPVARAEKALEQLSSEFSGWMDAECERLDNARVKIKESGFTKATREALFHAAHDIKGEAATFGFPSVASAADSLCRLIEHTPDMLRIPHPLVDQHVDAIRAIVRENARPDGEMLAIALTRKLREVTEDFLQHENRHRPDYLDTVAAPPLAPGEAG
jgi:chemotaxis protein histidine kinase CheA